MPMESAHRPLPGLRQMVADFGGLYLANAVIGFIFAASGPVAIILAVGARGGLSESDLSSWIFGAFFINGLITLLFCTLYRQPLVFFWTIPGTVLVGPALGHLQLGRGHRRLPRHRRCSCWCWASRAGYGARCRPCRCRS